MAETDAERMRRQRARTSNFNDRTRAEATAELVRRHREEFEQILAGLRRRAAG